MRTAAIYLVTGLLGGLAFAGGRDHQRLAEARVEIECLHAMVEGQGVMATMASQRLDALEAKAAGAPTTRPMCAGRCASDFTVDAHERTPTAR